MNTSKHFTQWTYYPWLAIILAASFLIYKYVLYVFPSIMPFDLMRTFHVNATGLGHLSATFFYVYSVTQLFVGVILDRFSVRYFCAFAIAISAMGAFFFSGADELTQAVIARGMMGFGAAFATVAYMKVAAVWFREDQFAFVAGLLATAAMVGAIFGEAPLAYLISLSDWRAVILMCAVFGLVLAGLFVLVLRDKPITPISEAVEDGKPTWSRIKHVLTSRQNWLLTMHSGLTFGPITGFGGLWGNAYLAEHFDISMIQASSLTAMMFLGLAFGGPILGLISDRLHRRRAVMLAGNILASVSLIIAIYYPGLSIHSTGVALFLFGFGVGGFMLGFAVGRQINSVLLAATVVAMINTGDALFEASMEPLIGIFLDIQWTGLISEQGVHLYTPEQYQTAFLVMPMMTIAATFLLPFIKEPFKR